MPADTMASHFTAASFKFLSELEKNNTREWFNDNRETYDTTLAAPFEACLEALSKKLASAKVSLKGGPKTMFRMNRDVRFSKDKRPYKTAVSGMLTPDGSKNEAGPVLYLQCGAKGGFMAAGYHQLGAKDLGPIRDKIVAQPKAFEKIIKDLAKNKLELDGENSLTAMPRGYENFAQHFLADVIKLKSLIVREELPKSAWLDGSVIPRAVTFGKAAMPMMLFVQG